ncbi:LysR family transcriptional regulator [Amycolatopsis jiangsuensis]|uniref:DNA-binding transcriptional LysR family regulator n=1 Tax=Amycolatopsis jiangsuensis TaxID=1181879 RepID=A0A840IP79_9PSEU|nr:LysR family transcriptional regulator [Amycolatopsis jiangsuensis]MBB4683693.1 DNA-binding transcriptional LysR family regulator [Amycolatopsis jiangsuensis]
MDTRRLRFLLELSRLGSMRAVADVLDTTTSTVSQQIAVLAKETGVPLLEPDGRRVRLTPAGRRLAEHAVTILAAVEAARVDLDPGAEPAGVVRVAGFGLAIRRSLLPVADLLASRHPEVRLVISEHEPGEALTALLADDIDLALTYDYELAPATAGPSVAASVLWTTPWGLGVPAGDAHRVRADGTLAVFRAFSHHDWIGNSRNNADEEVVRTLASMAGFAPRFTHRADSLELVADLIAAGGGVGLLPMDRPTRPDVTVVALAGPDVLMRAYTCVRRGRDAWPPLALVLDLLRHGWSRGSGRGGGAASGPVIRAVPGLRCPGSG